MSQLTITQSLNKNKKFKLNQIDSSRLDIFVDELKKYLENIDGGSNEHDKRVYLRDFFISTFYKEPHVIEYDVDNIDLTIKPNKKRNRVVLIETKDTKSNQMVSVDNLNKTAFHELLLYYMNERIGKRNLDLTHLIITNMVEFFIFDAAEFERFFYDDSKFRTDYSEFIEGKKAKKTTEFFYKNIASPKIEEIKDKVDYLYIDLKKFALDNSNEIKFSKVKNLYKVLSDTYLLEFK